MRLLEALRQIESERLHSFHMPGHKYCEELKSMLKNIINLDITEIPGSDNLHSPEDCIMETQIAVSRLYNSYASRLLVNGSTVGILSMILGCTNEGDGILINRNAHKSIYNGVSMARLKPYFYVPNYDDYLGIVTSYDFDDICKIIKENGDIKVLVLTYPTYEGICVNISEIIELCHARNIIVLVDEAHGAHLKISDLLPLSSLEMGADIVVQSFHKMLPALTQTACLHFGNSLASRDDGNILMERVDYYLRTLQTSSPSYILMASIDAMLEIVEKNGLQLVEDVISYIDWFYNEAKDLKCFEISKFENQDPFKILIRLKANYFENGIWDGERISKLLRERYSIQSEYDTPTQILLISSICSSKLDFEVLIKALREIDLARSKENIASSRSISYRKLMLDIPHQILLPHIAINRAYEWVLVVEAAGRISADYIVQYPPGIPICIPGEIITEFILELFKMLEYHMMGSKTHIKVLKEINDGKI